MNLTLGFSPCPNDCFMFDAIVHRRIDLEGLDFTIRMADIEALNAAAFAGGRRHKLSSCVCVLLGIRPARCRQRAGRNCGPLLISKRSISTGNCPWSARIAIQEIHHRSLSAVLAFPAPRTRPSAVLAIEGALLDGSFDAFSSFTKPFTYAARGLKKIIDLVNSGSPNRRGHPPRRHRRQSVAADDVRDE